MIWPLLRHGLLVGVLAGLAAGGFAFVVGEPLLQEAIDLEAAGARASLEPAGIADGLVSRPGQRAGLLLASALYGACLGILFATAFALARGRLAARDDWQLCVRLGAAGFAAVVLVPFLKYPANPPGIGDPATVGTRTWLYLVIVAGGLVSLVAAARVMRGVGDAPAWRRPLAGAATFVALTTFLAVMLPGGGEVPAGFPAGLLWEFRLSSLGSQAVLWSVLAAGYGVAVLRAARTRAPDQARAG